MVGAQQNDEIRRMNWLGKNFEEMTLGLGFAEEFARFRIAGKQNDSAEGQDCADLKRCLDPVHSSHEDVDD